jgi:hypothetical protein
MLRAAMAFEIIIAVGLLIAIGVGFTLLRGSAPTDPTAIKRRLKDHQENREKSRESDDRRESLRGWLDSE